MKHVGKIAMIACAALLGCGEKEIVLEGERQDILPTAADSATATRASTPLRLSPARNATSWGHRSGDPQHRGGHVAFSANPRAVWTASIGTRESRRSRILADPVSDGARIFTIDAATTVVATSTAGARIWQRDLTPPGEKTGLLSGGGLAVSGGTLYVTSPYGSLLALRASDGALQWEQRLEAMPAGPPVVRDGLLYLVTRDNRGWAIDTGNGRIRWQISGLNETKGFAGGAGPAVDRSVVVFPFSSGELITAFRQGGLHRWSASVSGSRTGRVYATIGDFASDPVISGDRVYAGTQSGRVVAMDVAGGARLWTTQVGITGPLWVDGNALWSVSDEGALTRIDNRSGRIVWTQQLPHFDKPKPQRRKSIIAHYGPILAGGRLWVASSDQRLRSFDPATGAPGPSVALPSGAAAMPIVVGRTLYVVSSDGNLRAFR